MKKGPVTPKGFRDILPDLAKKRRETINKIAEVLEEFGFSPLETPTIEFAETLLGKYGEDEKLIYQFTDRGGRKLALRYDLTVPLARYVANNNPKLPFRRYQVGQVFRGENPQRKRYREFTQFDFDTVGSTEASEDAKIIAAAIMSARKLGVKNAQMAINDRVNFRDLSIEDIRIIDKIQKLGRENIRKELLEIVDNFKPTENLKKIFEILERDYNLRENKDFSFSATLARGLDYYTSTIFEMVDPSDPKLSLGGGGRYDNLIGSFSGRQIPAVGFSFGRLIDLE